jgi:ATP-dependent protease ClpP protease subunit
MSDTPRIDVINFVSGINPKSVADLIDATGKARNNNSSKIILNISSTGGDLHSAFAAYYHLRSLGIPLISHNMGNIESAAVILYLAADTRIAAPHSRFLIHSLQWTFGGEPVRHPILRENVSSLDFDAQRYGDIFKERTQGAESPVEILKAINDNVFLAAASAVHAGICSTIAEPAVLAGANFWWISPTFVS